jgi:futalosine hydrolase
MGFKILLVAATYVEAEVIDKINGIVKVDDKYNFGDFAMEKLITGIGGISTAWSLKHWFDNNPGPNLVINIGLAGSFNNCYKIGSVVVPATDCFADFGIENCDKEFFTVFEEGLIGRHEYPFKAGNLKADLNSFKNLNKVVPFVSAVTVNTATGSASTVEKIKNKFNPDVETMEGATFFYICAMEKIPFLAIRAISNMVEPRDKTNWNIPLALGNLAKKLEEILLVLNDEMIT